MGAVVTGLAGLKRLAETSDALTSVDLGGKVQTVIMDEFGKRLFTYYPDADLMFDERSKLVKIHAKELWFREFGTGLVGQGTYPSKLPTQRLTFQSYDINGKGHDTTWTTEGWKYLYHPHAQKLGGWYYKGEFISGESATAGIYLSARTVKWNMARIVQECLRSIGR